MTGFALSAHQAKPEPLTVITFPEFRVWGIKDIYFIFWLGWGALDIISTAKHGFKRMCVHVCISVSSRNISKSAYQLTLFWWGLGSKFALLIRGEILASGYNS